MALENVPKSTKVYLSVVGLNNDLSDSEICLVDTNITTDSQRTPDEKLLQEFTPRPYNRDIWNRHLLLNARRSLCASVQEPSV